MIYKGVFGITYDRERYEQAKGSSQNVPRKKKEEKRREKTQLEDAMKKKKFVTILILR